MRRRRSASIPAAELTRAVLTPIADRHGIDYDESAFTAPASDAQLGFEAIRCCTGLVTAFAYEDAWPNEERALRKLAKTAAALVRDSFHDQAGRDAVARAAVRYGQVMAELRRASADEAPGRADAYATTADADERLSALAGRVWPVDPDDPALAYARTMFPERSRPPAGLEPAGAPLRTTVTIETLSLATWPLTPDLQNAFARWAHRLDLEFVAEVQAGWTLAARYWANLIGSDPLPYTDMVDIVAAERGRPPT